MISVNHNLGAANVANTLNSHYSRLQTSTQRLSSGLRINSAADDAAGLAIRELQRADIAALHQGARNANDAISMLQTFDGALAVIDEKLIRMKELAEQAATGTYNSTQRLMIDSEFQAMASEITRIARATDFNGIKLIDGSENVRPNGVATAGIAPFAEINSPDDTKKFDVTASDNTINGQPNATITANGDWDLSGITDPEALANIGPITITNNSAIKFGDKYLLVTPDTFPNVPAGTTLNLGYNNGWQISATDANNVPYTVTINMDNANSCMFALTDAAGNAATYMISVFDPATGSTANIDTTIPQTTWTAPTGVSYSSSYGTVTPTYINSPTNQLKLEIQLDANNVISKTWDIRNGNHMAVTEVTLDINVRDITPAPPGPGPNPPGGGGGGGNGGGGPGIPDLFTDKVKIHFGPGNDSAEDYYYIRKHDATIKGLGLDGVDIQTQQKAQEALVKVNDAIVQKDKIRAEYGAMQNRLENTLSNLTIQAENLQASESRISDVDVATEMTNFVRNQVLTQSAVAMLSQANSMPQMVMSLIG